jgi:SAM-dependent methyltransferase
MADSDADLRFGSGIGEDEVARLEVQGGVNARPTRMIFAEAGIRPGMRVLDLGCGAGDTAFVAADLVGPEGWVVGLDHSPDALARARYRAGQRGLAQVQFIEGDIQDPAPGGPFDAITEQMTLWRVPDPAEVLRRQATVLRRGGLVVLVEPDFASWYMEPPMPLLTQTNSWILQAMAGSPLLSTARRLWAIAEEAGLRPQGMLGVQPHFGPGDERYLPFWVEQVRNLVPVIVGADVATAEQIGIETFEQRLTDEWARTRSVIAIATMLSVWATTGPD